MTEASCPADFSELRMQGIKSCWCMLCVVSMRRLTVLHIVWVGACLTAEL